MDSFKGISMKHSKNLLAVLFTCAFLSFPTTNVLADDVDLTAVCPLSVVAGSPLVIDITVSNKSFTEVTVNRFMTALGRGSKKNTLGMIGVYGPFAYNLSESVTVPGFTSVLSKFW